MNKVFHQKWAVALVLAAALMATVSVPAYALFGGNKAANQTETAQTGAPVATNITAQTYQNIPYTGTLKASDTDGGQFTFNIITQPGKGSAVLLEDGMTFVYTPMEGKTGKDSFTFTATDKDGNTSQPGTVSVVISKSKSAVTYADMGNNAAYPDAVRMAEKGVMVGRQVGAAYLFEPETQVTRSEFLAMAMTAAGAEDMEEATLTGFQDDASIPTWAKSYVATAVDGGIVNGYSDGEKVVFAPESGITFNEAATIMNRILSVSDIDTETWANADIPTWAVQSVANLSSVDVISDSADYGACVTRADAAKMLAAAMDLLDARDNNKSALSWIK